MAFHPSSKAHPMTFQEFLKAVLPEMHLKPGCFNRSNIKRKCLMRMTAKCIRSWGQYLKTIEEDERERDFLASILTITISRFFRDSDTFQIIRNLLIPSLIKEVPKDETISIWSAGCASGEEPFSIAMIWDNDFSRSADPDRFRIDATDINYECLARVKHRIYPASSVACVPKDLLKRYFKGLDKKQYYLKRDFSETIRFFRVDLKCIAPSPNYHMILCRNLAFTYFEDGYQREVINILLQLLLPGGYLVLGKGERLPLTGPFFKTLYEKEGIYKRNGFQSV